MYIEKQKNGYCDIAELILWLDANIDRINYNITDSESLDYDMLFQKLKESRYINIDRFEKAFDRLQEFFASKKDHLEPIEIPKTTIEEHYELGMKAVDDYIANGGFKDIEPSQTNKYANNAWDLHRPIFDEEDATPEETEILKVDYSGKCEYSGTPLKEFEKLNHKLFFED